MRTASGNFRKLLECVDTYRDIWYLRFNVRLETNDEGELVTKWEEELLNHKPTLDEIKEYMENYFNTLTLSKILHGFVYNGMLIWLSTENLLNYKSLYDILEGNVTIKVNTSDYYTFETFEEYKSFYLQAIKFIQDTIKLGWNLRDSFDYTLYIE